MADMLGHQSSNLVNAIGNSNRRRHKLVFLIGVPNLAWPVRAALHALLPIRTRGESLLVYNAPLVASRRTPP